MTDIVEAVRDLMVADTTGVFALTNTRIYPGMIPLGTTLPAISYKRVDETSDNVTDYDVLRLQVTSVASTYLGSLALAAAVRKLLNRKKGVSATRPYRISFIIQTEDEDSVSKTHWVNADYRIVYQYLE